jgi:glyoxylase-like metal-dependent hydrolase (beta-lactamase superfamily II)
VQLRAIGGADGILATIAYVPELRVLCSGDIAYNNIHMWMWSSTPESRKAWRASLDAVAAFKPVTIVTGHKDPDAPNDDAGRVLDQSRRYLEDFEQAVNVAETPQELIDRMLANIPRTATAHPVGRGVQPVRLIEAGRRFSVAVQQLCVMRFLGVIRETNRQGYDECSWRSRSV